MTEIVVGVDGAGAYVPVAGALERLAFSQSHVTLLHAAPDRLPFSSLAGPRPEANEHYAEANRLLGEAALREAMTLFCSKDLPCEAHLLRGNPAPCLIERGKGQRADLIAVNAQRVGGTARGSYSGSVSRALTIGSDTSLLVVKGPKNPNHVFRAIFATDHSPFAERCLDRFLKLAPKGIEEVHVLSAWNLDDREAESMGCNLAMLGGDAERWIEERVTERNAEVVKRLEAAGYRAHSIVKRGKPNDLIHHSVLEIHADLLILGSQGHGAMACPGIGSVSLHQALAEWYPVLILRPSEAP